MKSWKDQPLLSSVSGEIQEKSIPTWRPACELISWLFSPHRELLTLYSHRRCELTDFPGPNPARPTLLPLLRLKLGLSSHRWTRSHVVHPGLCLESSGALPTHHTDAPTEATLNCWEGISEVISWHWSCDPDGKPEGNYLAKDSFWTTSMNTNPSRSGPHSKMLWTAGLQCGCERSHQQIPLFSDVSSPKSMFRSPELKASHSPHLRLLCREAFGAGISERSKLGSGRENRSSCSSAFISYPEWSASGSLGWLWINPFKPVKDSGEHCEGVERLLLNQKRPLDSWPPEENNSIWSQRWGLITRAFA